MDAIVVPAGYSALELNSLAKFCRLGLEDGNANDGNGSALSLLALARPAGAPDHGDNAVTGRPDLMDDERDRLLSAVAFHELGAGGEDGLGDVFGFGAALVDNDGDSGRVVNEVWCERSESLLFGVPLDD